MTWDARTRFLVRITDVGCPMCGELALVEPRDRDLKCSFDNPWCQGCRASSYGFDDGWEGPMEGLCPDGLGLFGTAIAIQIGSGWAYTFFFYRCFSSDCSGTVDVNRPFLHELVFEAEEGMYSTKQVVRLGDDVSPETERRVREEIDRKLVLRGNFGYGGEGFPNHV